MLFLILEGAAQRFAFAKHDRWAGVDSAWEQKKLEARKMFKDGYESHLSSARFVRRFYVVQDCRRKKDAAANLIKFYTL